MIYMNDLMKEIKQLRAENARLTEIASEKATRMDELYEALSEMVNTCVSLNYDHPYLCDSISEAHRVLNKNNPDGES